MPTYIISKEIEAANLAEAIKNESKANIVSINEKPVTEPKLMGFQAK